jgi:mannose-1-phosphate guanylyltransferase/mannose-6-phosphate isomerase
MPTQRHTHGIVLAGGEGARLAGFTGDRRGRVVPKQFALRWAGETPFQATLRRARRLLPPEQITLVLAAHHRRWWTRQMGDEEAMTHRVVQPTDRGSATAALAGLQQVLARDPGARVLLLPSDHAVRDEEAWIASLCDMIDAAHEEEDRAIILGMPRDDLDAGYGCIVPGAERSGLAANVSAVYHDAIPLVAQGREAPGILVNTTVLAGDATALVALYARAIPDVLSAFQSALGTRVDVPPDVLAALYSRVPKRDLAHDVLERSADLLSVVQARRCGWADLDTPERVAAYGRILSGPRPRRGVVHP